MDTLDKTIKCLLITHNNRVEFSELWSVSTKICNNTKVIFYITNSCKHITGDSQTRANPVVDVNITWMPWSFLVLLWQHLKCWDLYCMVISSMACLFLMHVLQNLNCDLVLEWCGACRQRRLIRVATRFTTHVRHQLRFSTSKNATLTLNCNF